MLVALAAGARIARASTCRSPLVGYKAALHRALTRGDKPVKRVAVPADDHQTVEEQVTVGDWRAAEALAAWHMRQMGFEDADVTSPGADGGIDVAASKAVAQVKHYASNAVGAPAVQQLRGAAHGYDWVLFYALSGYSRAAAGFAEQADVALFTYDTKGAVTASNGRADLLLRDTGIKSGSRADRRVVEEEARRIGQRYFDLAVARYSGAANALLREAERNPRHRKHMVTLLSAENSRVTLLVEAVGQGRVPLSTFTRYCNEILAAAERLKRAL